MLAARPRDRTARSAQAESLTMPLVSVIMPTFNRLQFLAPAIDSLFARTFTDWACAESGRLAAAPTLLHGWRLVRYRERWAGLPRAVPNMLAPRALRRACLPRRPGTAPAAPPRGLW